MDPEQIPLRDLHLPDPVGWWPLAPGWWVLIALAVAGIVYLLYRQFRRWRHNRLRRIALAELSRVYNNYRQGTDALTLAKDVSELLRRAMLAYSPRSEVAGLTGEQWLAWLDRGLDDQPFTTGVGRKIESLPYQRPESIDDDTDISGLIDVVRRRISTPLPEVAA
jgi:hypothetical protein